MKVYMVFINMGFSGVKYFQHQANAEKFAKEIGEEVVSECATTREYFDLDFSDPIEEVLVW